MKSPKDIAARMQRQWEKKPFRVEMLTTKEAWPKHYSIGIPSANDLKTKPVAIQEHIALWRQVSVGEVNWSRENYRASSKPILMPSHWTMERPSDWVRATASGQVAKEFSLLENLIEHAAPELHNMLIGNLKLLQHRSLEELLPVLKLSTRLKPGEAQGRPLRLLSGYGVDTKFFERNKQLLIRLLDARFHGEVSKQGLHEFLDAAPDGDHWLLIVGLQKSILTFEHQQVRSQELATLPNESIQASRILVVENRQCWRLLPKLPDTLAILGSGLDLDWLKADWLDNKTIGYWGDMDTWGLHMLARVRQFRPQAKSLLMDQETFDRYADGNAVVEPVKSTDVPLVGLSIDEQRFYQSLLSYEHGRLEQEYLSEQYVHKCLEEWANAHSSGH